MPQWKVVAASSRRRHATAQRHFDEARWVTGTVPVPA
jgi:hypothetical protein